MAHYTQFNLSATTQVLARASFRTAAFMAETLVFVYLGMSLFTIKHDLARALPFAIVTIVLIVAGRAANIFPMARLANSFRAHQIPIKHQVIMWFSGLRGAIAFALSISAEGHVGAKVNGDLFMTGTLLVVIFTIVVFGGGTLPLLRMTGLDESAPRHVSGATAGHHIGAAAEGSSEGVLSDGEDVSDEEDTLGAAEAGEAAEMHPKSPRGRPGVRRRRAAPAVSVFQRLDQQYLKPMLRARTSSSQRTQALQQLSELTASWTPGMEGVGARTRSAVQSVEPVEHTAVVERRGSEAGPDDAMVIIERVAPQ